METGKSVSLLKDRVLRFMQGRKQRIVLGLSGYIICAAAIAGIMYALSLGNSAWISHDAGRFHEMARMIVEGMRPYVDYIDPKPPLLFFSVSVMDLAAPAGTIDTAVMTVLNLLCACLIWKLGEEDYGFLAGYTAGFLFLVASVFTEGYFLFSEQFAILFLLLSLVAARRHAWVWAGVCVGLAIGYKQYALVAILPLLYFMWASGDKRYYRFLIPVAVVIIVMFAALFAAYGSETGWSGIYYTFGVMPEYISGKVTPFPTYAPDSPLSFAANAMASVAVVLPTLVFAIASLIRRGLRTPFEIVLGLFLVLLLGTLLIRQYLHYWILLLPFLVLFACREFADDKNGNPGEVSKI